MSEVAEVQLRPQQQQQEVVAPRTSNLSAAPVRRVSSNHALSQGVCIRQTSTGVSIDDLRLNGSEEMELEESDSSEVQAMNQVKQLVPKSGCSE